ncbi:MAG: DUF4956 domain-containing protein [Gammaproteobacteria bacterium]|jgi:uncharacterized membrane protein YhiD involved in acid resistance|nr:DUF4956 domain-containing protein [Gammaproteobacteria bacterium]MBT3722767.1 DUF4956 domain-containing protein [Gammaproteobacteria bacterium]MBT4077238.1 DUF4956 domain-containing protein [Gammaproteobacteria bacterium]MBT4195387.1 DUF4956 domain-containing protein [Gammaproteobacteria bacterium]MBT4448103.1 DUF4956 domain-containing protein [Gammaproteobacteria bacterium]
MLEALTSQSASEAASLATLLLVVILSFVLSTFLAYVYQKTFRGLSYSRNYVQAIVLISIISSVIIQAVGDSLARGIGIMAAMAIIRFRTNLKDPRDTLFLFSSLAAGIACGAYAFTVAIVGTLAFSIAALLLHYSPLGPNSYFDGMLRFNLPNQSSDRPLLEKIMNRYCKAFSLVTLREIKQGERLDYAYHIKLRRGKTHEQLLAELKTLDSLSGVNLMMQEATVDL